VNICTSHRVERGALGSEIAALANKVYEASSCPPSRKACFYADVGRRLARSEAARITPSIWFGRADPLAPQENPNDLNCANSVV